MKRQEDMERLLALSDDELRDEAARSKEALFRLNYRWALGEIDVIPAARKEKKTLARILTVINARKKGRAQ